MSYQQMIYSIIASFSLFAVLNIVIRFTVFRMYGRLRAKGIEINTKYFFQDKLLKEDIASRYPEDQDLILKFVRSTKYAMVFASILIAFILGMAYLLLKMK